MAVQTGLLDSIGLRSGTDKSSAHHNYLHHYERLLNGRSRPIRNMLEVGIYDGASLRMWAEFLPDAKVTGADIDPRCQAFANDRMGVELADQSNPIDLTRLGVTHGPFDLIIDDGSHIWSHQILTFETLFPFLEPGGTYILEDIDTSFGHFVADYGRGSTITAAQYITRLSTHVLAGGAEPADEFDARMRAFVNLVDSVTWIRRSAIIQRK